ncbi:hypothetical protein Slin15195_G097940 [Septoria linicola]|uniref:Uncharacterized protein n=1 Tax=Septoria linicola TaxID=215465 RepID=A0A9Q9EMW8_9PEZI|nr:hypothetical protein Slin15195_G097940 [Septoria linicola]
MVHINTLSVATIALHTASAVALPQPILGPVLDPVLDLLGLGDKGDEHKYSTLTLTSSIQGVFPTQHQAPPTGTDAAAQPTDAAFPSGLPSGFLSKRKVDGVWDPTGFVGPTATGSLPVPTGGFFPGFKQGDIGTQKHDEEHHKGDKKKHSGSKKKHGDKKKHKKPQGLAQPAGTGSLPAPTGSLPGGASDGGLEGVQKRQFGGVRHGDFQPHWAGSPAQNDSPAPTGTGAALPTGTGGLAHGKPALVAQGDDDDKKPSDSKDKKEKKKPKSSKKKGGKKHKKPQGVAALTGTGGVPVPTGGFSSGGSLDSAAHSVQNRQFGVARQHGFQPHWAGSHEGDFPVPTGTSPPFPTGTGH